MRRLALSVSRFSGPLEWDWSLTEAGQELGRHTVRIAATEWQFAAFADLFGHVGWRTTAASRRRVEPLVARQLGEWAAERLLGDLTLHFDGPATVEVIMPGPAAALGLLPLEAMVVGDRTLALRRVTFVFHTCADGQHSPPLAKRSPGDRLRILAVFSLPSGTTALALRRERVTLSRLLDQLSADIDLRVLQYGTTREMFRQACADPLGWDVVHVSGHGEAASIVLETPDSEPDPMRAADLVELMLPLRDAVSLVTLSSCESAAIAGDAGLARDVARRLDCSVMAMRFPVGDEFAADLVLGVYDEMIREQQELPAALGETLERLGGELARKSQLSFSTPTLFGCRAASVTAFTTRPAPSGGRPSTRVPAPARFVGRVDLLAKARRALMADSTRQGVVFQGMTGVGKTACARELADISASEFEAVAWHSVPAAVTDPQAALVGFTEVLDEQHPGLGLRAAIGGDAFVTAVSALADRCRRARVLTVLDDAGPLLDERGRWYTFEWRVLMAALTPDAGASRLILTNPAPVAGRYEHCIVHPLSRDESLLLIRELPQLSGLLGQRTSASSRLIGRVLDLAQGHPAVLELAEAGLKAGQTDSLIALLDSLAAGDGDYPQVLVDWAERALLPLADERQRLFRFICCLEEPDRQDLMAGAGPLDWSHCWRTTGGGAPVDELLPALLTAALISRARGTLTIHPAVVAHIRAEHPELAADVTEVMAGQWGLVFVSSRSAGADAGLRRLAAWRGLPYATRLQDSFRLQVFVDHILREDHSRATSIVLRSAVTSATGWQHGPQSHRMAGYLLAKVERDLASDSAQTMRSVIADALAAKDWNVAEAMSAEMFEYLYRQGDLDGAQAEAEAMAELLQGDSSVDGRLSRVTAGRFQVDVLNRRGRYPEALAAGTALLRDLDDLEKGGHDGYPGTGLHLSLQRQRVLSALSSAARGLDRWEAALDYDRAHLDELVQQGASPADQALTVYNTYIPLVRLGRLDEAAAAVAKARKQFERTGAQGDLGRALGAQGEIEIKRGHPELALDLVGEGLRHSYRQPDASTIAIMHGVYGGTACNTGRLDVAVAHLAAAAALHLRMGDVRATGNLGILDVALRQGGAFAGDEAALATIERTTGPGFRALAEQMGLPGDALASACEQARRQGGALPAHLLAIWDPILSALAATAQGDAEARTALVQALDAQETNPDWAAVVSDIRALLDRAQAPSAAVDDIDRALRDRAQAAWTGQSVIRRNLWRAIGLRELMADVVLGALGDRAGENRALAVMNDPRIADLPLSTCFRRLLAGERDRDVLVRGLDPIAAEAIETILDYVT